MTYKDELWALEEKFWTGGAESARAQSATGAVVVFPYPAGILQGNAVWGDSVVAQRWRSIELSERVVTRNKDIAVLAYHVSAERVGMPTYEALCTSTYLSDDGKWLRMAHQQTPVE